LIPVTIPVARNSKIPHPVKIKNKVLIKALPTVLEVQQIAQNKFMIDITAKNNCE
jgi:hypothetical protein